MYILECRSLHSTFISLATHRQIPPPLQAVKGLFTRKSDFALGLQVYKTNSIFLYMKMK